MSSHSKKYKLYKSGKKLVTAAVVSIAVATGLQITSAHADTNDNSSINTTQTVDNSSNVTVDHGDTFINGNHYYYDPQSGQQEKGIIYNNDNGLLKYYDDNTGIRGTYVDGYTFNPTTGDINTATLTNGIHQIDGSTYYFDSNNSRFFNNGWKQDNNNWYFFNQNGKAQTGWFKSQAGRWYFFDNHGAAKTGWYQSPVSNFWYYFDPENAWALQDWQKLDGNWYHFDPTNGWANTGWFKSQAGRWYFFDDHGAAKTGWYQSPVSNFWYYFDPENAWALQDWQYINDHWYNFDPTNGWAITGWFHSNAGNWFYLDPTNAWATTGWYQSPASGFWYYFDPTNAWAQKGWFKSQAGRWYYFDPENAWADTGWQYINGHWYYFDPTNAWMLTGTQTINGKAYTFNENGAWADEWGWPFPQDGEGYFSGAQLFGVHPGGEFRMNGFHDGLDFGSYDHPGSEVHAIHGGTVKLVGYTAGLDWYCVVDTGEYLVVYQEAFASRSDIHVHEGQHVNTGDVIGIRNTSHVHIGITRQHNFNVALANSFNNNGTWLDPLQIIKNGMN